MLLVNRFFKHVAYPSLAKLGYLRNWRTRQCDQLTVLTYHGVFPEGYKPRSRFLDGNLVSADRLHQQLRVLKCHYNVIAPEDFKLYLDGNFQLPPRGVLLTCDDGLANTVSDMLPVLRDVGLKSLFFITGASFAEEPGMLWHEELWLLLDAAQSRPLSFQHPVANLGQIPADTAQRHRLWWHLVQELSKINAIAREQFMQELTLAAKLPEKWKTDLWQNSADPKRFQLLTSAQVNELTKAGMTIGAHTMNHPVLEKCSKEIAETELGGPLKLAQEKWNTATWALAYSYGTEQTVSNRELAMAETAGYHCAFMNTGAGFSLLANKFAIPRINITADMNLGEFEAQATAFHQHLQKKLNYFSIPPLNQPVLQQR